MTRQEEKLLFEGVINGDRDAIITFYEHYKRLVYSTIRKYHFIQEHEVDDLFQEFMLRLMENNWHRLALWKAKARLSTYLVTILRNFLNNRYHWHQDMEDESKIDDVGEDPSEDIEAAIYIKEVRPHIQKCVKSLSERDREIFNRAFNKDQSAREIANALGINKGAYYTALHHTKRRLADQMREKYPQLFEDDP